ncbi:uncharacterized protein LOC132554354 [Ylistrum balloti]|uniref:uncharacterized protein LOC132554354 n=1 Tax=Ylistrum balloti TaxID=509963 RepID=UPI002905A9AC|nr:uncharacterized protein LOC132554354 [Ylistrum balloti]
MMDHKESERISLLLSTFLERYYTRTQTEVDIRRKGVVLGELLRTVDNNHFSFIESGSQAEGFRFKGSDTDCMYVDRDASVMNSNQYISQNMKRKNILYMRKAACRPGYVHLEVVHLGPRYNERFLHSVVQVGNSKFVSSDMYREYHLSEFSAELGEEFKSNGPSVTFREHHDSDNVYCFSCNTWPQEAREWITRSRLYGWPSQTLINKTVQRGCHLVPVGDKCSEDTFLQWRISFATAERSLVHSFSHVQFKVYALLKYFLKQIKATLKEKIGDDEILCSYFLKTILFHAIENSRQEFWQDKNMFYCFWLCFNILIAWVSAGFCPNYFIPANNLFQRKVHGQHQQILLDVLNHYSQMKWKCLSVGNYFKPIWNYLSDASFQTELERPIPLGEIILNQDLLTVEVLPNICWTRGLTLETTRKAFQLLITSRTDTDDIFIHRYAMKSLQLLAEKIFVRSVVAADNKTTYRRLKKCKHWMVPNAIMGTELLHLATFHFLIGDFRKSLAMSIQAMTSYCGYSHHHLREVYKPEYFRQVQVYQRLQQIYMKTLMFYPKGMCLPHLSLELSNVVEYLLVPPMPYALFLTFLCCHELGEIADCDAILQKLEQVKYDDVEDGRISWIVHTIRGICYQTIGHYHLAIRAYWKSARASIYTNPAFDRIAVAYLCMYVSQGSDRG